VEKKADGRERMGEWEVVGEKVVVVGGDEVERR